MCLAFVASAYWTSGVSNINPIVYTDAKDMYQTYEAAGLIHFHSQSDSPPVGAFVFYPGLSSDGHIGISVGYGNIISATEITTPPVWQQGAHTFSAPYEGWAYPSTAFR